MTFVDAHVAGLPVEETVLPLLPVAGLLVAGAGARVRTLLRALDRRPDPTTREQHDGRPDAL
jgi:hypothetical protein